MRVRRFCRCSVRTHVGLFVCACIQYVRMLFVAVYCGGQRRGFWVLAFCFVGWGAVGHALRTWRKAVSVVLACLYVTVRSSYIAFLFGFVVRARLISFSAPSSGTEWRRRLININRLTNRSAFCMLFRSFRMFSLVLILSGSG